MSEDRIQDVAGLTPEYRSYERQKCFIAYTQQTRWSEDLLCTCEEVLSRPEFGLELDYARRHFRPDIPLLQKTLELVANARCGIYDLSYWRDDRGEWHLPCNVFIELGMAIALNRPALLLRHADSREAGLPSCIEGVRGDILEFGGQATLRRALVGHLAGFVNRPPEEDWWNYFCTFGRQRCDYRAAYPRANQWAHDVLHCHILDGPDSDRDDFRAAVDDVLGRFKNMAWAYHHTVPTSSSHGFQLCTFCQTVRSTPLMIYRITRCTPAHTFLTIGMSIALESQFECKIPKVIMAQDKGDVPSLLAGYEVALARSDKERKSFLREFIPVMMAEARRTAWRPRPLPFLEEKGQTSERASEEPTNAQEQPTMGKEGEGPTTRDATVAPDRTQRAASDAANTTKEFLNISEAARLLGVEYKTVYRLVQHGALPAGKVGGVYRIRRSDVDAYFTGQQEALAWEFGKQTQLTCGRCLNVIAPHEVAGFCEAPECAEPLCGTCWGELPDHVCQTHIRSRRAKKRQMHTISIKELRQARAQLEKEQERVLMEIDDIEQKKAALDGQGRSEASVSKKKLLAEQVLELEARAQACDRTLSIFSKQLRIVNGFISLKETSSTLASTPLGAIIGQMDMTELQAYVDQSTVDGSLQLDRLNQLLNPDMHAALSTPGEGEA